MATLKERIEICDTVEALRHELEGLVVRGLRAAGANEVKTLEGIHSEFARVGANHLAGHVSHLLDAVKNDDRQAAAHLQRLQTSLNVFERVLTLDTASQLLAQARAGEDGQPKAAPEARKHTSAPPPPPVEDRKKLLPLLEDLGHAVEELCGTGLTTATDSTKQRLDVSFKEASRLKLLRLGTTLRYVNEELHRFLTDSGDFASKRLSLFLNRSWVLAQGMSQALQKRDDETLARLLLAAAHPPVPVKHLEVAVLGINKRVVQNSCSFDFRLRTLREAPGVPAGQPLTWSCLFARQSKDVPAEAYLHLPQPQKFNPKLFLENTAVNVTEAAVVLDDHGGGRLMLGPKSTVSSGEPFSDYARFATWDLDAAHARVAHHVPGPLDLPVEMQEEVVLTEYEVVGEVERNRPDQKVFAVRTPSGLELDAVASTGPDGEELIKHLKELGKGKKAPLFGLMHYELCRLVFQPLSTFDGPQMTHLMISDKKINLSALLGTLNLTR